MRDFLSPLHWFLIDSNVIRNCLQKFVLITYVKDFRIHKANVSESKTSVMLLFINLILHDEYPSGTEPDGVCYACV